MIIKHWYIHIYIILLLSLFPNTTYISFCLPIFTLQANKCFNIVDLLWPINNKAHSNYYNKLDNSGEKKKPLEWFWLFYYDRLCSIDAFSEFTKSNIAELITHIFKPYWTMLSQHVVSFMTNLFKNTNQMYLNLCYFEGLEAIIVYHFWCTIRSMTYLIIVLQISLSF